MKACAKALRLFLLGWLSCWGALTQAEAQYELKQGTFNLLFSAAGTVPGGATPTTPQFRGVQASSATAGPRAITGALSVQYRSQIYGTTGVALVLIRGRLGYGFAMGVPRFVLGEVIPTPATKELSTILADASYWRNEPVKRGETFSQPGATVAGTPRKLTGFAVTAGGSGYATAPLVTLAGGGGYGATATATIAGGVVTGLTVTYAGFGYTSPPTVTFSSGAAVASATMEELVPSESKLMGFTLASGGNGYTSVPTVTLSGGGGSGAAATATVSGGVVTALTITNVGTGYTSAPTVVFSTSGASNAAAATATMEAPVAASVYYSPHADRVFAHQAGRASVTWITNAPQSVTVNGTTVQRYLFRQENFSVSSASAVPTRAIYWTEKTFAAPPVSVLAGAVEGVNPMFSGNFPEQVAVEYDPVGISQGSNNGGISVTGPITLTMPVPGAELRTIWFQKVSGVSELRAYNLEGRIMVEYLGALKTGAAATRVFLGADIVDVVRTMPTTNTEMLLGEKIIAQDAMGTRQPLDPNVEWLASPVNSVSPDSVPYYSSVVRGDGRLDYYAERANDSPDRVAFYWLASKQAAITFPESGGPMMPSIYWPQLKNAYVLKWPTTLASYAHNIVPATGSSGTTGVQFAAGNLPSVVFQDDPTQAEAKIDLNSQRFVVNFTGADGLNRTLLKFTSGTKVWYVRLYTQSVSRAGFEESDGVGALTGSAVVGQRLVAPIGCETAGHVETGTNYNPAAYLDPLSVGVAVAAQGAIIPVNAMPGATTISVWWLKAVPALSLDFQTFYLPAKKGVYTTTYPATADKIVLASNSGSGDLSSAEVAGQLYIQNNRALPGFNPNEEHAMMLNGRAYALRDDLNVLGSNAATYTSEPAVLVSYTSPTDGRPAMHVFKVQRELSPAVFNYPIVAGTQVSAPMPIPLLPLALDPATGLPKNTEVALAGDAAQIVATAAADVKTAYASFLFRDRKGYHWVYRGPHDTTKTPTFGMKFWYPMRDGFYMPDLAVQPVAGTPLPYLRSLSDTRTNGDSVRAEPLLITYAPTWPANAPELRVGETLTRTKFGLPGVYGQTSAQVLYQQSLAGWSATAGTATSKTSVVLHDSFREKTFALGAPGGLASLPTSILTTQSNGKVYFQRLAPHLQPYVYFDPMRGTSGSLVFLGKFFAEVFGEDYVGLNVLSAGDRQRLIDLISLGDANLVLWTSAIDALSTTVQTFMADPLKKGSYAPDPALSVAVNAATVATVGSSETAVVNYAVTSTGQGSGWVTMVFGNSRAFTPEGEAVNLQLLRVAPQLYPGEVKVLTAANPLDEQVTLRHTADFAAKPDDYEFDWRYAPSSSGKAPAVYTYTMTSRLASTGWKQLQNPSSSRPTPTEIATALTVNLPRQVTIKNASYASAAAPPGIVLRSGSGVDFSATGVPSMIVFSADIDDYAGFAVAINDITAISYKVPGTTVSAIPSSGLVTTVDGGLKKQFVLDENYFRKAVNKIEIALYTSADAGALSSVNFALHASQETDQVVITGSSWAQPTGTLSNIITVGGSPTSPLGSPLLVMSDNYFTMRYRPKIARGNLLAAGASQSAVVWSRWTDAKLVEGWIKRVLAGINPFNQRMSDLGSNAVSTDVSILTQAGKRWEGNVALSLSSINDFGLIEIYETLLSRAKTISIDAGYDYGATNDALLLAAGYLNDLYVILGNEAYADAADPTISVDSGGVATEVSTTRFAFEGQSANVLEEELMLLRGRDDTQAPGVAISPVYNRLIWNYTRGINSGEALYALNYNITDKAGSSTANGVVDAADAQRMFPQGHGDAYGHYLSALTGYYKLLRNPKFTWTPRIEAVTILGQPVAVDYYDERKFADSGSDLARTAQQILNLTYRQAYKDDPGAGWAQLRDGKANSSTGITRNWGVDEWAARSIQGSYFNWVVGNALLPDKDTDPEHSGISVIDRRTVPSLQEIALAGGSLQSTLDGANARLNPLGLSPGAIAFDISPSELKAGKSHYEQIYERSLRAANNAKGAFDQAAKMARMLRTQAISVDSYSGAIADQEAAYVRQLVDIYGKPYSGEIGPGKVYAQGYNGPDTLEWFIVDRPSGVLVDTTMTVSATITVPKNFRQFSGFSMEDVKTSYDNTDTQTRQVVIQQNCFLQYADLWANGAGTLGTRPVTGTLQQALLDSQQAQVELLGLVEKYNAGKESFKRRYDLYAEMVQVGNLADASESSYLAAIKAKRYLAANLSTSAAVIGGVGDTILAIADGVKEAFPTAIGFTMDPLAPIRGGVYITLASVSAALKLTAVGLEAGATQAAADQEQKQTDMEQALAAINATYEDAQIVYEYELMYRELVQSHFEIAAASLKFQRASEQVNKQIDNGTRLLAEREVFRQRASAIVQGYRTRDVVFRTFRNEALEQYRSLFDLASRYTYLAAKSYDYETGLLGSTAGQAVLDAIVASRALGDLTGGVPQVTAGSTGDSGLAGTMARLQTDWSVAKSRLGINNPDQNGTLFSLRRELFRLRDDPSITTDDTAWRQTLEQNIVPNLLADPDVAALCRNLQKPDGGAVPGIIIPFRTAVQHGQNFFGLPLADGDHAFSPSNFSTKIYSVGVVLSGYVGMDPNLNGSTVPMVIFGSTPNALSATPYVYLIPTGTDYMRSPPLGETDQIRGWKVADQALPLPFNLGATAFSSGSYVSASGTLSETPWVLRKHQAFRPVSEPSFFYSSIPAEFTNSRLVGRSAWNSGWKIVIPAYALYSNEQEGLNRLTASLTDIKLFLRTYSNAGN
jgi:hypothetical protein